MKNLIAPLVSLLAVFTFMAGCGPQGWPDTKAGGLGTNAEWRWHYDGSTNWPVD